MAKNLFLAIIFSSICVLFAEDVSKAPLMIYTSVENPLARDYARRPFSSITTLEQNQVEHILKSIPAEQKILIVLKDLSPEMFRSRDENGKYLFSNLMHQNILEYYTSARDVEAAARVLGATDSKLTMENTIDGIKSNTFSVVKNFECPEGEDKKKCIYVLDQVLGGLTAQYPEAVCILTAETNSNLRSRKVRAADGPAPGKAFAGKNFLFYSNGLMEYKKQGTEGPKSIEITAVDALDVTDSGLKLNIDAAGYNIKLDVVQSAGSWAVSKITVNNAVTASASTVAAPITFSYACSKSFYLKLGKSSGDIDGISISNLQLQLQFHDSGANLNKFGDAYNCVGFTSPAIWAGMYQTFFCYCLCVFNKQMCTDIENRKRNY